MAKKTGRPSKITIQPQLQEKLCGLIARGHYASTACGAVGLGESTYFRWMELGADHVESKNGKRIRVRARSPYREFREAVEKAKATAQMFAMEAIRDAAFEVVNDKVRVKTWQAAAWYLERTAPEKFANRSVVHESKAPVENPEKAGAKKRVVFGGRYRPDGNLQTSAK